MNLIQDKTSGTTEAARNGVMILQTRDLGCGWGCERVIDQIESMPAIVRVIDQIESMPAIVTLSVLSGLQRVRPVVRFGKRGSL